MTSAEVHELTESYAEIIAHWEKSLKPDGVPVPNLGNKVDGFSVGAVTLIYLYRALRGGNPLVSKEELTQFIKNFCPDAASDCAQAARHLKYAGFDVRCSGKSGDTWRGDKVRQGHYVLDSLERPSRYFTDNTVKRSRRVAATDWTALKVSYGNRCGVCRAENVPLEKGHKNPNASDGIENLIPICASCNNWASNDVVFDDDGRVVALASPKLVLASDEPVQAAIYRALKPKFKR